MILNLCPNPSIDTYAWLNNFEPGGVNRIDKIREYPGGKGIHVALAIAEIGSKATVFGNWAGNTGDWIKNACEQKDVVIAGVELSGNNRKCYTFRSGDAHFNNSELLEPGPVMNSENWEDLKKNFEAEIPKYSIICMSGSWPQNAPANAYQQLINIAKTKNRKVLLDCSGSQLEAALESGFFGLHLNEHEAEQLCGSTKISDLLKKLDNKVDLVALTKGKEGLCLYYKGEIIHANVLIDQVLSTVGSGDCLTAGIAYAVEKDLKPKEIAAYGVACGAANCMTEDLGMLERDNVEKLLSRVEIKIEDEY